MHFACRLAEKAHRLRHRIYFNMKNKEEALALDEMLWVWRADSFLPHNLYGEGPEPAPPVQIGTGIQPKNHSDILINLSDELPECYRQFSRILEVIPQNETAEEAARTRFRIYREKRYLLQTHKTEITEETHE